MLASADLKRRGAVAGCAVALAGFGAAIAVVPGLARLGVGIVICVAALTLLVQIVHRNDTDDVRAWILGWTLGSFALHAAIGAAVASSAAVVSYLGPDAFGYHEWALQRLGSWTTGVHATTGLGPGKSGFTQLLALFYWITTPTMVAGTIMNAAFAGGLVCVMHRTTVRLFGRERARYVPVLMTLLPPFLVWPSQLLREASILFLISVIILAAVSLQQHLTIGAAGTLIVASVLLLDFRGTLAYPLVTVVLLAVLIARRNIAIGIVNATSLAMLLAVVVGVLGIGFSGYQYATDRDLTDLSSFRQNTSRDATSGFDDTTETDTTSHAIAYVLVGAPRLLLGPAPWQARGLRQAPAAIDALVWWWLLYWAVRGFRAARVLGSRRPLLTLVVPAAAVVVMLSLALGNYGLVVRQRPQVLLFLVPLIAFGLSTRSSQRTQITDVPAAAPVSP